MLTPASRLVPSLRARSLLALALGAAALGCATAPHKEYVFPPPPEVARIKYVRSFRSSNEMDPGIGRRILNAILPSDPLSAIKTPTGLALSPDERFLYVTCGASQRIVQVDLRSKEFSSIGPSNKAKRPAAPYGVAVDAKGNVYVTDRTRGVVFVYDEGGNELRKIGEGKLEHPTDLAIDREAQLLYVVSGATSVKTDHRIEVFSLAGEHLRTIGKRGEAEGQFNFPTALVVKDGILYVADMLNFRVQSFDREGKPLGSFGKIGIGAPGAFDKIRGLAFDSHGNVYVVDARQGVHILNPSRQPLLLFGGPPFMTVPDAIAIDSHDRIFVADFAQDMIHEYQLVNAEVPPAPPPAEPGAAPKAPAAAPPATGDGEKRPVTNP